MFYLGCEAKRNMLYQICNLLQKQTLFTLDSFIGSKLFCLRDHDIFLTDAALMQTVSHLHWQQYKYLVDIRKWFAG